ncbi:MAG: LuxR C-terminal-related transcriptional regulator [Aeromicrobium sp.]
MTGLCPRETEVLRLVPEGMANKQIARRLGIPERTVKAVRGANSLVTGRERSPPQVGGTPSQR